MAKPSLSAATGKPADFRKVSAPSKAAEEDDKTEGDMKAEQVEEEQEEDYMSMALPTTTSTSTTAQHHSETYTQRRERKAREAEAAQPRSKTELVAAATAARDAGLATSLAPDSRGAKMLAKLGYTPGEALGARGNLHARVEPLVVEVKEGREGVGMEGERKRKVREEMEEVVGKEKRVKAEEIGYRERVAGEREERRMEGMWWGAMKVLEGLEEGEGEGEEEGDENDDEGRDQNASADQGEEWDVHGQGPTSGEIHERTTIRPLKKKKKRKKKMVNIHYRPLIKQQEEVEKERRARYDLLQSLSRDRTYADPEEGRQDRLAFGSEEEDDGTEEEEDVELSEYLALEPRERLAKVVIELRSKWRYCFWCKTRYENKEVMDEECPGLEEEDHE